MERTAESLYNEFYNKQLENDTVDGAIWEYEGDIIKLMINFATLKVIEAREAIMEKAQVAIVDWDHVGYKLGYPPTPIYGVDSESILNAYDLNDIK